MAITKSRGQVVCPRYRGTGDGDGKGTLPAPKAAEPRKAPACPSCGGSGYVLAEYRWKDTLTGQERVIQQTGPCGDCRAR